MGVKIREKPPKSGTWWVFIDHEGKRKAKKIGKDRKLAQEVAKKIEAKLALGDVGVMEERTKTHFSRVCGRMGQYLRRDISQVFNARKLP